MFHPAAPLRVRICDGSTAPTAPTGAQPAGYESAQVDVWDESLARLEEQLVAQVLQAGVAGQGAIAACVPFARTDLAACREALELWRQHQRRAQELLQQHAEIFRRKLATHLDQEYPGNRISGPLRNDRPERLEG